MMMSIYIYFSEEVENKNDFIINLWYVYEHTQLLRHINWLDWTNIEWQLAEIEKNPKHVVTMLNSWKNPISSGNNILWNPKYPAF
jgi:hypothetical protein